MKTSRDAGKKDAGKKKDARVEEEPEPDDDSDDDVTADDDADDDDDKGNDDDEETPPRNMGGDAGRDGGTNRDSGTRDAARDATPSNDPEDARVSNDAGDDEPTDPSADCPNGRPSAQGLKIREVALYQTVKVSLFKDGNWASMRPVPVVQGKKALVRVFVEVGSNYQRKPVRAALRLANDGSTKELSDEKTIASASTDADTATTFNFMVEPSLIGGSTQVSVALEEPTCGNAGTPADGARVPSSGAQQLMATKIGKLRMVVVPISVGGRLPNTSEMEIDAIKQAMLAYYPVPDVEVTVRDRPITVSGSITGSSSSAWTNTLNQVMRERAADRPESDVYYFGLMQPAATMQQYCSRGCILGIAPQATRQSASSQVGLGASFSNAQTYETIVHEIGHAHGRGHAPCVSGGTIQGVDRSFPDSGGSIMTWGWDSRSNKLLDPSRYKDVMGYCSPNWISPYTYNALATRAQAVNTKLFVFNSSQLTRWRDVILYADGSARWGGLEDSEEPGGEPEPARVLDASGNVIEEIEVVRMELSHSSDQLLYIPAPGARWATIQLRDRTLPLSSIGSTP